MKQQQLWERFKQYLYYNKELGLTLDYSKVNFPDNYLEDMEDRIQRAYGAMEQLEAGAIANPDEGRMVGHYWLRAPHLAPTQIRDEILTSLVKIEEFTTKIHQGQITSQNNKIFKFLLVIGIGGSALGTQFVSQALGENNKLKTFFMDNTDPAGFDKIFGELGLHLDETLVLVISKSGGTKETRNGMLEAEALYRARNLSFAQHAVAITGVKSQLDIDAQGEGWLARFPLWDWVGGRTSVTSVVGLLPLALQGINIADFLEGAAQWDQVTRTKYTRENPSALLALMWYFATGGKGKKDMVIIPYKDSLQLFAKYLQQLIMESLGKEKDLDGNIVKQGITVYGNKGSTDQHAYVQQLLDGVDNSFITFIEVLKDRSDKSPWVEDRVTSGDYLMAFLQGTKEALRRKGRDTITIGIEKIDARSLGGLIALYERSVGLYASLVNINAYHQPGVESGKKVATGIIALQRRLLAFLAEKSGQPFTVEDLIKELAIEEQPEQVLKILEHAAYNGDHGIGKNSGTTYYNSSYFYQV